MVWGLRFECFLFEICEVFPMRVVQTTKFMLVVSLLEGACIVRGRKH